MLSNLWYNVLKQEDTHMQKTLEAIKKPLFERFEVRKSAAQKAAFADWACEYARGLGYEANIEESGKWIRTRNVVFGDLAKARTLITAHYDTCARLPFGNTYTPACWPVIALTQLILPLALFLVLGFVSGFASARLVSHFGLSRGLSAVLSMLMSFSLAGIVVGLMLFGPANPHTANDNTSGVAMVLLALHIFSGRNDVAFVLFDNEEIGLLGSSAFVKAHPSLSRRALLLNFDCVSDGDTLLFAGGKIVMNGPQGKKIVSILEETAAQHGKKGCGGTAPKVLYPSDQLLFRRGAAFAALKGKRILYMDRIHSAKDTMFNDGNLLCLAEVLEKAI